MIFYTVLFEIFVIFETVISLESTKEPTEKDSQDPNMIRIGEYIISTPSTWEINPDLKSLWVFRPASLQSQLNKDESIHQVILKPPHLLTRLAKPLWFGFDPYFRKDYFEPFERRPKPVTLIAFRKNGFMPHKSIPLSLSSDVAELQSPYNDISSFWDDNSGNQNDV
ncbi:uncharacterized protein LOC126978938 [Leptidea sinapis]|uniref:uncharacterized protein LOC126978938 n=1 Tax=Leptidea sinapis TaxID=189913 RepID=UPI0021C285D7|nr:uncharacterized protein LOC126978938 [Leptidea sinapis]